MTTPDYTYIKYVIRGGGSLSMEQHFGEIPYIGTNGTDLTQLFDSTHALHIDFDVRIFNEKLGIYKDASNTNVIDSSSTILKLNTSDDSVNITADEFLNNITEQHVRSVGKYSTIYREFKRKSYTYFGYADGFDSLYDASSNVYMNYPEFTSSDFINIITERYLDLSNNYVYKLNGIINVFQLTNILNFVTETNPFNNRNGHTIYDGFIAGDRILILSGITITLDLKIEQKAYIENPLYEDTIILQHTSNAPLLLTLQNLS